MHPGTAAPETEPAHLAPRSGDPPPPTLGDMRRHIAELCVKHEITPLLREPDPLDTRPGSCAVVLRYIGDPSGYWACLYDIGLAIADPASDASRCELAAWAWARKVALVIPESERPTGYRDRAV